MEEKVVDIILKRLDNIEEKQEVMYAEVKDIHKKIAYFAGFFAAAGAFGALAWNKIYIILFGA